MSDDQPTEGPSPLAKVAPAFVEMAHRIVWCAVATVDDRGRPWSRILHPLWRWDGSELSGVIATEPTPLKQAQLAHSAFVACSYWAPAHDTATAQCEATWALDDRTCRDVWEELKTAPAPVGYDPAIVPAWQDGPTSPAFAVLRLRPWRLRVFPGSVLMGQGGDVLAWRR